MFPLAVVVFFFSSGVSHFEFGPVLFQEQYFFNWKKGEKMINTSWQKFTIYI